MSSVIDKSALNLGGPDTLRGHLDNGQSDKS